MPRLSNLMGSGVSAQAAQHTIGICTSALTATGSAQTDALLLPTTICEFTTTASSTGAILPANCNPGDRFIVYNIGAQTLSLYPPTGESINAIAANSPFSVATAKTVMVTKMSPTRWATLLTA